MWDPALDPGTEKGHKDISGKTGEIQIKSVVNSIIPVLVLIITMILQELT